MVNTIRSAAFEALTGAVIEARHKAGMTQRDLAARLGCRPSAIANIETGQRRIDVIELIALARALGVSAHDLFAVAFDNVKESDLKNNFGKPPRRET